MTPWNRWSLMAFEIAGLLKVDREVIRRIGKLSPNPTDIPFLLLWILGGALSTGILWSATLVLTFQLWLVGALFGKTTSFSRYFRVEMRYLTLVMYLFLALVMWAFFHLGGVESLLSILAPLVAVHHFVVQVVAVHVLSKTRSLAVAFGGVLLSVLVFYTALWILAVLVLGGLFMALIAFVRPH